MSDNRVRKLQYTIVQLRKMVPKTVVLKNNKKQWEKIIETLENNSVEYEFPKVIVGKINQTEEILRNKAASDDNTSHQYNEEVCSKYIYF